MCAILCDALEQHTRLSCPFSVSQSLFKLMSIESVIPSNHLILCRPLLLLPSIFPSIGVFSNDLALPIKCQKYWSFRISPSDKYSGLIALLCPRDSQESSLVPQFENISSSALRLLYGPAFHLYMTTGKTIALTIQTFVGKIMSLLFNTLSRFVIAFLPRSKHLLISWLQSLFGAQEKPLNTQLLFPFSEKSRFHMAPVEIIIS